MCFGYLLFGFPFIRLKKKKNFSWWMGSFVFRAMWKKSCMHGFLVFWSAFSWSSVGFFFKFRKKKSFGCAFLVLIFFIQLFFKLCTRFATAFGIFLTNFFYDFWLSFDDLLSVFFWVGKKSFCSVGFLAVWVWEKKNLMSCFFTAKCCEGSWCHLV